MKTVALVLASMAAMGSAQVTVHSDGTYTCSMLNSAYCAGTTLDTNIIIRCVNGTGYADNCNDNLAGSPPLGVNWSPCWQSDPKAGDAACSKNGTVYPGSGSEAVWNSTAPFPVPGSVAHDVTTSGVSTLPIITFTSTRTNSHYTTVTTSEFTTITTYITSSGTASSATGFWTTYIKAALTTTASNTPASNPPASNTPASTPLTSSTPASVTAAPEAQITPSGTVSDSTTVFTTVDVTVDTTICPESLTASSLVSTATSTAEVTTSITIMLANVGVVHPSAPAFSIPLNTTTINVGPGPVLLSTIVNASHGTLPTVSPTTIDVASSYASPTDVAHYSSTMQTSAGVSHNTANSTFAMSPNATAGLLSFTGNAARSFHMNSMVSVVFAFFAVAWL